MDITNRPATGSIEPVAREAGPSGAEMKAERHEAPGRTIAGVPRGGYCNCTAASAS